MNAAAVEATVRYGELRACLVPDLINLSDDEIRAAADLALDSLRELLRGCLPSRTEAREEAA